MLYFDNLAIPCLVLCNGNNIQVKFGLTAIYQYPILLGENYGNLKATLLTVAAIKNVSNCDGVLYLQLFGVILREIYNYFLLPTSTYKIGTDPQLVPPKRHYLLVKTNHLYESNLPTPTPYHMPSGITMFLPISSSMFTT